MIDLEFLWTIWQVVIHILGLVGVGFLFVHFTEIGL